MTVIELVELEIQDARRKFPSNKQRLAALVEEVGELANALLEYDRGKKTREDVISEAVQVAAMAVRVAEEGSAEFAFPGVPGVSRS